MSQFLAIFPVHAPAPTERLHRQALNQLPTIVPDNVTITGAWTGRTWTDPDGKHWFTMTAPATGNVDQPTHATVRATANHIDPTLAQWIDGALPDQTPLPEQTPKLYRQKNASKPRLERLQELLNAGAAVEDALTECGWRRARSAGEAARRAGNVTLPRTLEAAA